MRSIALALVGLVLTAGCSDDHDKGTHESRPALCDEIASRCHPFETTSAIAKECHERAHEAWTETECNAKKDECFATCTATDSGTSDAPADGG